MRIRKKKPTRDHAREVLGVLKQLPDLEAEVELYLCLKYAWKHGWEQGRKS